MRHELADNLRYINRGNPNRFATLDRHIAELADLWAFTADHRRMKVRPPNAVVP